MGVIGRYHPSSAHSGRYAMYLGLSSHREEALLTFRRYVWLSQQVHLYSFNVPLSDQPEPDFTHMPSATDAPSVHPVLFTKGATAA